MTPTTLSLPVGRRLERGAAPSGRVSTCEALERLRPLIHAAAELDLDDRAGWARLRSTAAEVTAALVEAGLPPHLAVMADDPPAVVARTLAVGWRRATSRADLRHHRV